MGSSILHNYQCAENLQDRCTGNEYFKICDRHCKTGEINHKKCIYLN